MGHVSVNGFQGIPMPLKLVDSLSDVAARSAKPALRDGVPADRKVSGGQDR